VMSSTLRAVHALTEAQKTGAKSKYGNKKTVIDGIAFDSKKEAKRYGELKLLERAGQITGLVLQQKFLLFPKQRRDDGKAERECSYVADFAYQENGKLIVEDTKGVRTTDYVIKRKAMLAIHGITVREL
jgi:hypothetical protein